MDALPLSVSRSRSRAQPPHIIGPRTEWGADEGDAVPTHSVRQGIRAGIVHHTAGSNEYAPQDFGGHHPVDLRVPHPHAGVVRHRLQRAGRQVRPGLRGPRRRHGQACRGFAAPAASTATPGVSRCCGNFDEVAADADSVADHRPAARAGVWASTTSIRRARSYCASAGELVLQVPARCHADAADHLHPPRRRHHRLPGQRRVRRRWTGSGISRPRFNDPPGPARAGRTRCAAVPIFMRWESMGGLNSLLGAPTSPEAVR